MRRCQFVMASQVWSWWEVFSSVLSTYFSTLYRARKNWSATVHEMLTSIPLAFSLFVHSSRSMFLIWNLDERGCTPSKHTTGNTRERRYMRRGTSKDGVVADLVRTHWTSILPVLSASGKVGPALYVLKGTIMPYPLLFKSTRIRWDDVVSPTTELTDDNARWSRWSRRSDLFRLGTILCSSYEAPDGGRTNGAAYVRRISVSDVSSCTTTLSWVQYHDLRISRSIIRKNPTSRRRAFRTVQIEL